MARFFRLWAKKRGERRTGTRLAGTVGEAAFFGSIFVLGVVALATLLASQAVRPNPDFFRFGFGGWLALLTLTSLILVGGVGLFFAVLEMGASAERRSALVRRAGDIELIREMRARSREYPTIPRDLNLTNSPGVRLAFRLPVMESPAWQLAAAAVTATLCVGIDAVLLVIAIHGVQIGRPQWALTAFLIPFSSVTAWSVYYFVRMLLLHTWIGPTSVEISSHPLYPGESYEFYLAQTGHLRVERLSLRLICEEEATFRQGTDLRTERRVVFGRELFAKADFVIEPSVTFEHQGKFTIPELAMHSFQSPHNAISWKLVVRGEFRRWPTMIRSFPIVVYPLSEDALRGSAD